MEDNLKKQKIKEISIAIAVCTVVLVGLAGLSVGLFNVFYNKNAEPVQATSENKIEEENTENVEIELIDPETLEEEELGEEPEEEKEEELTEEEKQKREEEKKKKEEELKQKQEEERKRKAEGYPYWIKVNCAANTVTIYKKDDNGEYTVPIKAMVCSVGSSTPRSGVYKTPQKSRWGVLIGPVWGQYCTRITGQILFHSVPYLKQQDPSSLEYWEYDRLGTQRSLGCIRLTVADAQWIYYNCPLGTSVEFYSSSNPGPLGKPSAKKVTGYGAPLMNWDPTDPDPNNPWRNQEKLEAEKKAAEEAARKAEEERLAREKAEQEVAARKAEEERIAKEKAEAERKAEEERIAREEANKVKVPNVHGLSEENAKKALEYFSVTVETTSDSTKADGLVIWQSITAETKVPKGTAITIKVNKIQTVDNTPDDDDDADESNT